MPTSIDKNKMYVSAQISDGLGNRFFQVAAMLWYAKRYGFTAAFVKQWIHKNSHPGPYGIEFFFPELPVLDTIAEQWAKAELPFALLHKYVDIPKTECDITLQGYFQAWQYVDIEVPSVLQTKGFHIPRSFFLHVRRGDYLHSALKHHLVDLRNYIRRACALLPSNATVIVCSDDITWCKETIPSEIGRQDCVFFEGDDYETLRMMVHCDQGGICANSTFSWWGAYWGHRMDARRIYTMPDIWGYAPLPPADDLLPPWATIVSTT